MSLGLICVSSMYTKKMSGLFIYWIANWEYSNLFTQQIGSPLRSTVDGTFSESSICYALHNDNFTLISEPTARWSSNNIGSILQRVDIMCCWRRVVTGWGVMIALSSDSLCTCWEIARTRLVKWPINKEVIYHALPLMEFRIRTK